MRIVAMISVVTVALGTPVAAEPFPEQCYKELMLVTLGVIEDRCPVMKLTFAGHQQKVYLGKSPSPACLSAAQSKASRDAQDLQGFWCTFSKRMLNIGRTEPYVEDR